MTVNNGEVPFDLKPGSSDNAYPSWIVRGGTYSQKSRVSVQPLEATQNVISDLEPTRASSCLELCPGFIACRAAVWKAELKCEPEEVNKLAAEALDQVNCTGIGFSFETSTGHLCGSPKFPGDEQVYWVTNRVISELQKRQEPPTL